jgi:hypothetical protein
MTYEEFNQLHPQELRQLLQQVQQQRAQQQTMRYGGRSVFQMNGRTGMGNMMGGVGDYNTMDNSMMGSNMMGSNNTIGGGDATGGMSTGMAGKNQNQQLGQQQQYSKKQQRQANKAQRQANAQQGAAAAGAGVGAIGGIVSSELRNEDAGRNTSENIAADYTGGIAEGAAMGSSFGPWGMAAGALYGAGKTFFDRKQANQKAAEAVAEAQLGDDNAVRAGLTAAYGMRTPAQAEKGAIARMRNRANNNQNYMSQNNSRMLRSDSTVGRAGYQMGGGTIGIPPQVAYDLKPEYLQKLRVNSNYRGVDDIDHAMGDATQDFTRQSGLSPFTPKYNKYGTPRANMALRKQWLDARDNPDVRAVNMISDAMDREFPQDVRYRDDYQTSGQTPPAYSVTPMKDEITRAKRSSNSVMEVMNPGGESIRVSYPNTATTNQWATTKPGVIGKIAPGQYQNTSNIFQAPDPNIHAPNVYYNRPTARAYGNRITTRAHGGLTGYDMMKRNDYTGYPPFAMYGGRYGKKY